MYNSSLRHIHDPVLSSLKMKGIRLLFLHGLCASLQHTMPMSVCPYYEQINKFHITYKHNNFFSPTTSNQRKTHIFQWFMQVIKTVRNVCDSRSVHHGAVKPENRAVKSWLLWVCWHKSFSYCSSSQERSYCSVHQSPLALVVKLSIGQMSAVVT
jgi:hypothetical protein